MKCESSRLGTVTRLLVGTALLAAGAACSAEPRVAADGRPQVMAAFYPLRWAAGKVAGPDAMVTELTKPGVEPHDLELTPRQAASLETATLTVYIKGVQPAVDEAVEQYAPETGFDAATAVPTLPATAAGEHAEEGGEHAEEGGEHAVDYDPHLWLDPTRMAAVANRLGERLAAADPAHAAAYRQRAARTANELAGLDHELRRGLTTCENRTIVTAHTAFGYLAQRYGLRQVGISGVDPDAEPSPARLAEVAEVARREKVTTIFTEALVSPKVAEVLAKEVGARTAVLDPVESMPQGGDYVSAMRRNLSVLRTALGCT